MEGKKLLDEAGDKIGLGFLADQSWLMPDLDGWYVQWDILSARLFTEPLCV